MRVPKHLQPEDDIPYCCTWALLTAVRKHNAEVARLESRGGPDCYGDMKQERINNVICAGFGTGAGQFPLEECARQMVLAVKHFAEKTSNYFTEADGISRTADPSGLLTLWDEAEKIEDAVSSSVVEKVQQP
jgi:O-acetyl-ADP-ribose deacetylase (regulator of RNase III)